MVLLLDLKNYIHVHVCIHENWSDLFSAFLCFLGNVAENLLTYVLSNNLLISKFTNEQDFKILPILQL